MEIRNYGRGGANSSRVLEISKSVAEFNPTLIILLVGANDACNSKELLEPEEFEENIRKIIAPFEKNGVKIILMTQPPFIESLLLERHNPVAYGTIPATVRAQKMRDIMHRESQKNGRFLLDLEDVFQGNQNSWIRTPENSGARDGLHPTEEGYRQIALHLTEIIRKENLPTERIACLGDSITYGAHMEGEGTCDGTTYPGFLKRLLEK